MPSSIPVIVHLSGEQRGATRALRRAENRIGSSPSAEIHLSGEPAERVGAEHAVLVASADGCRLRVRPPHRVWVNGNPVVDRRLRSGDLLEIGEGGPLLRFRLQPAGRERFKSIGEALADTYQGARAGSHSLVRGALLFARRAVREALGQTSPATRFAVGTLLLGLVALLVVLSVEALRLGHELRREVRQVEGLRTLVESAEADAWTARELERLRRDLERRLESASTRLDFLEERASATERTIAEASRSIVFLQGAYGFRDTGSGRDLRFELGPDGRPLAGGERDFRVTTGGGGPVVEARYTGTGFIASTDGLVLTNRHVARPWEFDDAAREVVAQGYDPVMRRLIGYLPGVVEPHDIAFAAASREVDLAVLRCLAVEHPLPALTLATRPARVGQAIVVLGFPTGIQAMLARADRTFLEALGGERLDFWQIAERLSRAGQIAPLATRGIIGQVTTSTVVYDAETTSGGSGGPVLSLDGRVVGINSAVLRQFGGSNLGVTAWQAAALLERVEAASGAVVE